ncbi:MAG: ATP-binding protein [Candidatus Gracilibacteria bacterium]
MLQIDISNLDYDELVQFVNNNISDFGNFDLEIIFKTDYNQSKIIRDLILLLFRENKIEVPWKNRFALISDELVNNSIEYGSLPLDKNRFTIHFSKGNGILNINMEVSDTGRGIEAKTSLEMEDLKKNKESEGFTGYLGKRGRGLFQLVTNLVDELYFKDNPNGGLIVGVRKKMEIIPDVVV